MDPAIPTLEDHVPRLRAEVPLPHQQPGWKEAIWPHHHCLRALVDFFPTFFKIN